MKKKTIHIIGNLGNMGRRYASILRYLDINCTGHDRDTIPDSNLMKSADGFIIASPTALHLRHCESLFQYGRPVLAEKPLTTDLKLLDCFEFKNKSNLEHLTLVNQYSYLVGPENNGETYYSYFKSGSDGLYFDCLNVIGMAKSKPQLDNLSPVWSAKLNGKKLFSSQMDMAYVNMVDSWLRNPVSNYIYARIAHDKTKKLMDGNW